MKKKNYKEDHQNHNTETIVIKKRKLNKMNTFFLLIIFISLGIFIYGLFNIFSWYKDSYKINKIIDNINDNVKINEVLEDKTELVEQEEIDKDNPYWDYIKMKLIDVDFQELKKTNNDVKGWIQVNGTNINYPFVQTSNNDYYLTHSFEKKYNDAGWVFLDYRNNIESLNRNTIIYAHSRLDKTMFGTLRKILKNEWLNDTNNYVIKLSTEKQNSLWQVFSVYHIPTTSDYLQIDFASNEEFLQFGNMLKDRSAHNFNTNIGANDKILTLSTCYNDNEKMVMHAKLIKYSNK